jgi:hypothetical protein
LAEEQGHLGRLRRWLTWLVRVRIADLVLGIVLAGEACSRHGHFGLAAAASALVFVGLTIAIALVEYRNKRHDARVAIAKTGWRACRGAPSRVRRTGSASPIQHIRTRRTWTFSGQLRSFLICAWPGRGADRPCWRAG